MSDKDKKRSQQLEYYHKMKNVSWYRDKLKKRSHDRYHNHCETERKRSREWRRSHITLFRKRDKEKRIARLAFIHSLKSNPCMDCKNTFAPYVMTFDHRNPAEKLFSISLATNRSMNNLLNEIGKCDLVCANCHAIRTHKQRLLGMFKRTGATNEEINELVKKPIQEEFRILEA